MPDSGPTTAGSIVGKLKLDTSDWNLKLDEAEAKARELGRISPTIRVDADTAAALAKLEAIRGVAESINGGSHTTISGPSAGSSAGVDALAAAQRRLTAAEAASESATARAMLAEMRLDEVRGKGGRTAYQLAAAEEAFRSAVSRSEIAATRAAVAEEALGAAQRKAAEDALLLAAAEDAQGSSAVKANEANSTTVSRMALIGTAIMVLVPLLAPLTGYAVGVAGALAGMGAAGVLAIIGIKNAMESGSAVGNTYSAGLQSLKGDLDQLSGTAAVAMMSAFQQAVAQINGAMPELNGEIAGFSQMLGVVGNSLLSGVINSFRVLNPLFMQAGRYVEDLAAGFQSWTADGGLKKFGDYAQAVLPGVAQTLGALAKGVVDLVTALAPVGTVVLGVLTGLGSFLSFLGSMGTGLAVLAAGAGAAFLAFKAWGLVAPMLSAVAEGISYVTGSMVAFNTAVTISSGPIGWIIAGLSALAAIVAVVASATQDSTKAANSYTDALSRDNGVIGENVRQQAAKSLVDSGAIDTLKKLGVSAKTATDAAMGDADAQKVVAAAVAKTSDAYKEASKTAAMSQQTNTSLEASTLARADAARQAEASIKAEAKAQADAVQNGINYDQAMHMTGSVAQTMAAQLGVGIKAYTAMADAQNAATAAAKNWKTANDILNSTALTLDAAQTKLAADYITAAQTIQSNIKATDHATATSMDINTEYGNRNHQMIAGMIVDAQAQAQAIDQSVTEQTGSKARGDAAAAAFSASEKARIVDQMVSYGMDRDSVQSVVDTLFKVQSPAPVNITVNAGAALATVAQVTANLDALNGKNVYTTITTFQKVFSVPTSGTPLPPGPGGATGGLFDGTQFHFDGGGPVKGPGTTTSDGVHALLSNKEFVVKASSVLGNEAGLMYLNKTGKFPGNNTAPAAMQMQQPQVTVQVINKTGLSTLDDLIEVHVMAAGRKRQVSLSTGMQRAAY